MRAALLLAAAFGLALLAAPATASGTEAAALYDDGGQCGATIHTNCSHPTGLGNCYLYVGGPYGRCVFYE